MNKIILACLLFSLSACAYRVATPFHMPNGIQIQIDKNQARLVHSQTFIKQELAKELHQSLGWHIDNQSGNILSIKIKKEDINESAKDVQKISTRWRNTLNVEAQLFSPYLENKKISKTFKASASNSSLAEEQNALREASETLAKNIRTWLMDQQYQRKLKPKNN